MRPVSRCASMRTAKPRLPPTETWKWSDQTRYRNPTSTGATRWTALTPAPKTATGHSPLTTTRHGKAPWELTATMGAAFRAPHAATPRNAGCFPIGGRPEFPTTLNAGSKVEFLDGQTDSGLHGFGNGSRRRHRAFAGLCHINYIARAGRQTYISSDTLGFYGGSISVKSGRATILSLKLVERLYPFDVAGSFQSQRCNAEQAVGDVRAFRPGA